MTDWNVMWYTVEKKLEGDHTDFAHEMSADVY